MILHNIISQRVIKQSRKLDLKFYLFIQQEVIGQ